MKKKSVASGEYSNQEIALSHWSNLLCGRKPCGWHLERIMAKARKADVKIDCCFYF